MTFMVPYVPTPLYVVRKMLEIAGAGPGDVLYDLGCGDGRIAITAVREFNVDRAVCVEIREDLASEAAARARQMGLEGRVRVIQGDMFKVDISEATVVTMFLLTSVNDRLAPKLSRELKPGTRVVSHEFRITGWHPLLYATVSEGRVSHDIYLYVIGFSDKPEPPKPSIIP